MATYTKCSLILMILVFLFAAIAVVSLITAFICSIIYAIKFKNAIPLSCNSKNFALCISLAILIILFFVLLIVTLVITKNEKIKPIVISLAITILLLIAIFIILILIPIQSSNEQINKYMHDIIQKFLDTKSKCLNDFSKKHDCKALLDCKISSELIIRKEFKPIRKSSIILVSITDGSIVFSIIFLIFFFVPCPCGPIHDTNRF